MAGPLNGIGGQQIPLSNTFQPGGREPVQPQEDRKQAENTQQARQTDEQPARSRETEDSNKEDLLKQLLQAALNKDDDSGEVRRGSVVDIQV